MNNLEQLNKASELLSLIISNNMIDNSCDVGTEKERDWYRMLLCSQGYLKDSITMYKKEVQK